MNLERQREIDARLQEIGVMPDPYVGKSKTVYITTGDPEIVVMVFTDGQTGKFENGHWVRDPGGNVNIAELDGIGNKNLRLTHKLYELIKRELNIPTQVVDADLDNNIWIVKRGYPLTKVDQATDKAIGIEWLTRIINEGSGVGRLGEEGVNMIQPDGLPFAEQTLKDDKADDPLVSAEELQNKYGMDGDVYEQCYTYSRLITKYLAELVEKSTIGRELEVIFYDLKTEFAKNVDGELMLSDEISTGSFRLSTKVSRERYFTTKAVDPKVKKTVSSEEKFAIFMAAIEERIQQLG